MLISFGKKKKKLYSPVFFIFHNYSFTLYVMLIIKIIIIIIIIICLPDEAYRTVVYVQSVNLELLTDTISEYGVVHTSGQ